MLPTVTVTSPSATLAVYDAVGGTDAVVLLHGGPGCPDYLAPVAALLPELRTVRFDQRGAGRSRATNGSYTVGDHLDDIEAVRRHLGIERWHVFGHSWGGVLAQLYAAAHADRVRSLLLCNSGLGVGRDWSRTWAELARHNRATLGAAGSAELAAWQLAAGVPGPVGHVATARVFALVSRGHFARGRPARVPPPRGRFSARAGRATQRSVLRQPGDALARDDPGRPTLVAYGEHDIFGASTGIVLDRFPSAEHVLFEGCGHVPWLEVPDAFSDVARTFYGVAGSARRPAQP